MKIFSSKKRVAAIGVVTAATLVGGGMAVAYWTTSGTGTGAATTGQETAFEVSFDRDVNDDLIITGDPLSPGGSTQTTHVTVRNPGPGSQRLNKVVVSVNDNPGCTAVNFALNGAVTAGPATITLAPALTLAAGVSSAALPVSIHMLDTGVDQEGCKNQALTLTAVAS
jgi:hypothetical protein